MLDIRLRTTNAWHLDFMLVIHSRACLTNEIKNEKKNNRKEKEKLMISKQVELRTDCVISASATPESDISILFSFLFLIIVSIR